MLRLAEYFKMIKILKNMLLFVLLLTLPVTVFAKKNIKSDDNAAVDVLQTEEATQETGHSIKEYSSGTIYKDAASAPRKRVENSTNDDDPGFPGDPGQGLPVGDGFQFLMGSALVYFIYKKLNFKKKYDNK